MNQRIAWARKERNVKQDDLAKECGVTKNFISLIETGKREPSDRTVKDICRILSLNEDWLRSGTGEPFVPKSAEQELIDFTADLLIGEKDDFKKRLISALAKLSDEQWDLLESVIDVISQQKRE